VLYLFETAETFDPIIIFIHELFPAFGAPRIQASNDCDPIGESLKTSSIYTIAYAGI
jgi:hypothetical protein